jgi:hypothetical protein
MLRIGEIYRVKSGGFPREIPEFSQPLNCVGGDTLGRGGSWAYCRVAALPQRRLCAWSVCRFLISARDRQSGLPLSAFQLFRLRSSARERNYANALTPIGGLPPSRFTAFPLSVFGGLSGITPTRLSVNAPSRFALKAATRQSAYTPQRITTAFPLYSFAAFNLRRVSGITTSRFSGNAPNRFALTAPTRQGAYTPKRLTAFTLFPSRRFCHFHSTSEHDF